MRFGLDDGDEKTLDTIGKVYGVTRERIRQIESKTMAKLKEPQISEVLRIFIFDGYETQLSGSCPAVIETTTGQCMGEE